MHSAQNGFSLIEVVLVLALIGILSALTAPSLIDMLREGEPKRVAREVAGALRQARAQAIKENRTISVGFDQDSRRYWIDVDNDGNYDSPPAEKLAGEYPQGTKMGTGTNCDDVSGDGTSGSADILVTFQAVGSITQAASPTAPLHVCLNDAANLPRYRVRIVSPATGMTSIQRNTAGVWK